MTKSFCSIVLFFLYSLSIAQETYHLNGVDDSNQSNLISALDTLQFKENYPTESFYLVEFIGINGVSCMSLLDSLYQYVTLKNFNNGSSVNTNLKKGAYQVNLTGSDRNELALNITVPEVKSNSSLIYLWPGILIIGLLLIVFYQFRQLRNSPTKIEQIKKEERFKLQKQLENFHFLGLTSIFSFDDLETIKENQTEIYSILSYFATSLFDKDKLEDVLWDITKNCISKLELEDCVIYWVENKTTLVQKSAHGTKELTAKEILNPINIPIGEGIVGAVALSGMPELVPDVTKDKRYIIDDASRLSELAVPIFLNGEVAGVIDSEHSHKNFFTTSHLKFFLLIAKLLEKKLAQISDKNSTSITNDNVYFKELTEVMEQQKLYRDPLISLVSVADKLNISSGYLSRLINTLTGNNFNDYINALRVNDVQKHLKDPAFAEYSILSIGFEAGFNSKSVFYAAFKKHTGVSPSEYRKRHA